LLHCDSFLFGALLNFEPSTMKFFYLLLVLACTLSMTSAFAPKAAVSTTAFARPALTRTYINIGDQERQKLTRDSEPEDFFAT
jgi:hypothetical protein